MRVRCTCRVHHDHGPVYRVEPLGGRALRCRDVSPSEGARHPVSGGGQTLQRLRQVEVPRYTWTVAVPGTAGEAVSPGKLRCGSLAPPANPGLSHAADAQIAVLVGRLGAC